jgi:RNA polymerase sigma-70 factor (ECF subfamily)
VLRGALDSLAPEQRDTLALLYLRGLTMVEAAEVLDVPVGTVKSRARRALQALRGRIVEDPGAT